MAHFHRNQPRKNRGAFLLRMAVGVAAVAMIGLAWCTPRAARGDESFFPLAVLSQPGDRALRDLDHMPHVGVPDCSQPDVWVVSTRRLPDTRCVPMCPALSVERFIDEDSDTRCGRGRWERCDIASLLGPDEQGISKPLVIFIHGNRYQHFEAKQQGLLLARHCAAACPGCGPVRTVIFSWPSEQEGILLKDGRAKYDRAYTEGRYMAWLLGQIDPERPMGIIGYSFGAMITLEALKDLIAVEESGRDDLQPWLHRPAQTNLMFIAPAVRCDAFAPRGPYRRTLDCVDRVSLIINSRDDALRFFPLLDRNVSMEALGQAGMPRRWVPDDVEFSAVDGRDIVGKRHGLPLYLASPSLTKRLCSGAACGLNE